ncbi:hypothetical protein WKH74_14755 [Acinetobacter baumannii]
MAIRIWALSCNWYSRFNAPALPEIKAKSEFRLSDYLKFLESPGAIVSLLIIILGHATHFGAYTFLAPALLEVGIVNNDLTYALISFGLIGLIANFLISRFINKFTFTCLLSMQLLLAIALLFFPTYSYRLLGLILWAVAWGGLPLSLNIWNRTIRDGNNESVSSLFILSAQIAIALGSGIGGKIYDMAGLTADYIFWTVISLISAVVLVGSKIRAQYL